MKALTLEAAAFAPSATPTAPSSGKRWTGRILAGLPLLFMAWDATVKLIQIPMVVEASAKIGFARSTLPVLGTLELAAILFTLFPRTRVFGAVLLTAYLGGAVAIHVQHGDPLLTHTLFPVFFASLIWGGLTLLDQRVRGVSPLAPRQA
jgi:hypothetical protein